MCVCASRKHGGHQLGERGRAKKRTNTVVGECVTEDRERAIRVSLITRRGCLLLLLRQENRREGVTDRGRRGEQFEETRDQALPLPRGINHRPSVLLWGEPAKSVSRVVAAVEGQHALPHPKRHIDCAKGGRSSNFEQRKKKKREKTVGRLTMIGGKGVRKWADRAKSGNDLDAGRGHVGNGGREREREFCCFRGKSN